LTEFKHAVFEPDALGEARNIYRLMSAGPLILGVSVSVSVPPWWTNSPSLPQVMAPTCKCAVSAWWRARQFGTAYFNDDRGTLRYRTCARRISSRHSSSRPKKARESQC